MIQKDFLCSWVLQVMHLIASIVHRLGGSQRSID